MRLQQLSTSKWAALVAVAAGLISFQAAAHGELVVYATAPAATEPTRDLRREMGDYVEAINIDQKARIDAALAQRRGAEIQIAAARIPTRG